MHNLIKVMLLVLMVGTMASAVNSDAETTEDQRTFIQLFDEGVQSYLENNYGECVVTLEKAVDHYRKYYDQVTQCRVECGYAMSRERPFFPFNHENLQFFDKTLKRTLCLVDCYDKIYVERVKYPRHLEVSTFYKNVFRFRKPYEYLQLCYYRENKLDKAAAATYTVLIRNPEDKMMTKNFEFYLQKLGTVPEIDVEEPRFAGFYHRAIELYVREDYPIAIEQFEVSLNEYILEENKCRAFCEGEFDHGWLPDLYSATANHFVYTLHCKRNCTEDFRYMRGKHYDDIFPTHYEYLHFSYYKVGNLKQAIKCALSFLLFYPSDEEMLDNLQQYLSLLDDASFIDEPRTEAREYLERLEYEKQILSYVYEKFVGKTAPEINKRFTPDLSELQSATSNNIDGNSLFTSKEPKLLGPLHRNNRFVLDNLITETECEDLRYLLKAVGLAGDGYDGEPTPHTPHETFVGARVSRIALLTHFKLIESSYLKLLLQTAEKILRIVEKQYRIEGLGKLYTSYTHLVCRQANPGSQPHRFSHLVHADNCQVQPNNTCLRELPALIWRDVSALLYLNDQDTHFYGGDLMFSADYNGNVIEDLVHPKCGRLVTFTSDETNKHGVTAVSRGERCALAIWFTFDPAHKEIDYDLGYKVMRHLEKQKANIQGL